MQRLVIGLGNPGEQYAGTRHNIGFEAIDLLAGQHQADAPRRFKEAVVQRARVANQDVLLVKPMTFMNCSGEPAGAIARYYKVETPDLIVIHDELDFSPGEVRLKSGGGHGGHNGLRSLMTHVGADFARVRMGVGKPASASRGADYVLSRFDGHSRRLMDEALITATTAVEAIVASGIAAAMNRFNRVAKQPDP